MQINEARQLKRGDNVQFIVAPDMPRAVGVVMSDSLGDIPVQTNGFGTAYILVEVSDPARGKRAMHPSNQLEAA